VEQPERDAEGKVQTTSGSGEATVSDIALENEAGQRVEVVDVGQPATLRVKVASKAACRAWCWAT
jgi:lipopolysaccharide transport system ATP-binding protein